MTSSSESGDGPAAAEAAPRALYLPPASAFRARVEAALLAETIASAPVAAIVPLLLGGLVVLAFWASPSRGHLLHLLALVACTSGAPVLVGSLFFEQCARSPLALRRSRRLAGLFGLAAGTAFAAIPFAVLGTGDDAQGLILLAASALAIVGAWLSGPMAAPGQLYAAPIAVSGAISFAIRGGSHGFVSVLLLVAAAFLATGLRQREAAAAAALVDRLRVAEQADTMDSLLLDQDIGAHGWVWQCDPAGRLRDVDPAFAAAIDLPISEIEGTFLKTMLSARAPTAPPSEGVRAVRRAIADRRPFRDQVVELATPDGAIWWRLSGKPLRDEAGAFAGYRGIGADITAARDTEARIFHLANNDSLTGLANRARFQEHAARECKAAAHDGHWRAMLYLDLDGFKLVNDGLGHAAGDLVLKEVARRLEGAAPPDALVARLGGDEFSLWYPATPARAEALAQRLIEVLGAPFEIDGTLATIGASIGIAYTPRHAVLPDALLGKADLALYRAKADGKGVARTFAESDELAVIEKRKLDADLKLALARGEFALHYQPLVDLTHGTVVAFEALIRWSSPTRGFVPPAEFIPAAEASGLIVAIGRWVLGQACRDAAGWPGDVRVAVNASPKQFGEPDFPRSVTLALQASGLKPSRLEVEVTEGVFLDHSATALAHLTALRERGIKIALDDFGTGYSSLSYLTNFPVDKIKIDKSFVQNLSRIEDQAIVEAILTLARRLSIKVTAEGVETAEQAVALKVRRCDDIQGYLVSRPRPAAEVPAMLAEAPAALRAAIPVGSESPLALALAMKKRAADDRVPGVAHHARSLFG